MDSEKTIKYVLKILKIKFYIFIFVLIINMPSPIKMILTNASLGRAQFDALTRPKMATVPVPKKIATLKSPMIGRIHNVRPGCGSCGGH